MRAPVILATATILLAGCEGDTPTSLAVFSVVITAPKQTIAVGEPLQLLAIARDVNGVTIGGARFAFTSSAPGVANVAQDGKVTGVTAGSASVTAMSGGLTSAPFPITVKAASGSVIRSR